MIRSWKDVGAKLLFDTGKSKDVPANLRSSAKKKLLILNAAIELTDQLTPPGNRLEALKGNRKEQHSICIHDGIESALSGMMEHIRLKSSVTTNFYSSKE